MHQSSVEFYGQLISPHATPVVFQSRMVVFVEQDTSNLLSDEYAMELTVSEWPMSVSTAAPVDMSPILTSFAEDDDLVRMRRR